MRKPAFAWQTPGASRTLGALGLLVVGGVHFQLYRYEFYSSIPTIGPLFLVNFIAATSVGVLLLAPVGRRLGGRAELLDRMAALAGLGIAAGALIALLASEHTPLFGFMEHGYRFVIVLAITSEAVAITSLALFLACTRNRVHELRERSGAAATNEPVKQPPVRSPAAP